MVCIHPSVTKQGVPVPCGRCVACKIARVAEWSMRLEHELQYHEHASFVTLTYDDQHIPAGNSLVKRDLQLFFKRLRKEISVPIKYYACGEYGDKTARPHYHFILFGYDFPDKQSFGKYWISEQLKSLWLDGFSTIATVTPESIRYVCGYLHKKMYGDDYVRKLYGERVQPFNLMSKGLGLRYAQDQEASIRRNLSVKVRGKDLPIPRYYVRKLEIPPEVFQEDGFNRRLDTYEEHLSRVDSHEFDTPTDSVLASRRQNERHILARQGLKEKKI